MDVVTSGDLAAISDLLGFRRAMQAAVLRLGGLLNQTEMGRDTQIPRATMQRYLGLESRMGPRQSGDKREALSRIVPLAHLTVYRSERGTG